MILCRAVVLGALLPVTDDPAKDLDIFLKPMAMDDGAFGRRIKSVSPKDIDPAWPDFVSFVSLDGAENPYRPHPKEARSAVSKDEEATQTMARLGRPRPSRQPFGLPQDEGLGSGKGGPKSTWRRDIDRETRDALIRDWLMSLPYDARLKFCHRPEECDETELLAPIWPHVNAHLGTSAKSLPELVAQLGIARFGNRPKVADTFCGGGSIPFEAARIGCDVYVSDLNPIACMLTWGAFNIIGAPPEKRAEIEKAQARGGRRRRFGDHEAWHRARCAWQPCQGFSL